VRFVRRCVVATVVLPLMAAGCSDDPQPKFEPSPSDSPSQSTSDPAEPKAWEVKSEKGAVAFAEHWIDVFNAAKETGETAPLADLSSDSCKSCSNFVEFLNELYGSGGRFESNGWEVLQVANATALERSETHVSMRIKQSPEEVHRAKPPRVERFPGGRVTYTASLTWCEGRWLMSRLDLNT
jgi:hypothetical protein